MVSFENLKVGSRVQTSRNGEIFQGTVRYKGGLNNREGNWVGVELDKPVGYTSGLLKGCQYFQCNAKHGIFIRPRKLYLIGNWRTRTTNVYRTTNEISHVDETLFAKKSAELKGGEPWLSHDNTKFAFVTPRYIKSTNRICSAPALTSHCQIKKMNFHKKHMVGHSITPAATTRNNTSHNSGSSRHSDNMFEPSCPSIPDYHIPRRVLKRMADREYFGTSLSKQNTIY